MARKTDDNDRDDNDEEDEQSDLPSVFRLTYANDEEAILKQEAAKQVNRKVDDERRAWSDQVFALHRLPISRLHDCFTKYARSSSNRHKSKTSKRSNKMMIQCGEHFANARLSKLTVHWWPTLNKHWKLIWNHFNLFSFWWITVHTFFQFKSNRLQACYASVWLWFCAKKSTLVWTRPIRTSRKKYIFQIG